MGIETIWVQETILSVLFSPYHPYSHSFCNYTVTIEAWTINKTDIDEKVDIGQWVREFLSFKSTRIFF